MKPEKLTVEELFARERRFMIPLFQRAYVWEKEYQWEPLWEDISKRALDHRDGVGRNSDGKVRSHFLSIIFISALQR